MCTTGPRVAPSASRNSTSDGTDALQQPTQDDVGVHVLLGKRARRANVPRVVVPERLDGGHGAVHVLEGEEPLPGGQEVAEPGLLGDDGPPRGEVAAAAIAE